MFIATKQIANTSSPFSKPYALSLLVLFISFLAACSTGSSDSSSQLNEVPVNEVPVTQAALQPTPDTGFGCSADALSLKNELLRLINESRAQARNCGNTNFAASPPLTLNSALSSAAQGHSDDMAAENFFSHTGSNGLTASDRITAAGYNWTTIGENIAAGQVNAATTVLGWLESPDHCANMMSADFTELGAACASSSRSDNTPFWTTVFARSLNQ